MKRLSDLIINICKHINQDFFGSPWTFLAALVFVVGAYAFLPFQGFDRWNTGVGLFANSTGSNIELIVDIGIAVTTVSIAKSHREHKQAIKDLHEKLNKVIDNPKKEE